VTFCLTQDPINLLTDDLDIGYLPSEPTSEVRQIDKAIVTPGPPNWGPLSPAAGDLPFFAGFPAQTRGITPNGNFATVPYLAMPEITSVTDRQIACRINRQKILTLVGMAYRHRAMT